jgi:hypothetical protein
MRIGWTLLLPLAHAHERRARSPTLPHSRWAPNNQCDHRRYANCSEQVHLALGDGDDEMLVLFTTHDDSTPSEVRYWGADGHERIARGEARSYSALQWFAQELVRPAVGDPEVTADELRRLQNGTYYPPVADSGAALGDDGVYYGLGAYQNPELYYDSPLVHRVALRSLRPGEVVRYRVAGDDRTFSFAMPSGAGAHYPQTIGLVADLGQTAASEASLRSLQAAVGLGAGGEQPGRTTDHAGPAPLVLLAGDLAYADGYLARWDSFARMMEPLAARVPVATTGGNHEVGAAEAWLSYNARYRRRALFTHCGLGEVGGATRLGACMAART